MNKSLYRIIFNKARRILMAVAETACGHGTAAPGEGTRAVVATVKPLAMGLWVALGLVTCIANANAQIIADRSAPGSQRPTVLVAPSGAVQVNIQAPSAAGVSRNTYSQFDVQQNGAILNNSRTGAATQTGGVVAANPWLARGTARVILNEVNSSDPSQLKGYIEVAGDKAQVVIANPAGITCSGCGFINATRATVTTGTPIVTGGHLDGYRVERGVIKVEGAGMDARGADYTDIIARSAQVNAGIWAKELKVTAGANRVATDNSQATRIAGTGAAPAYAVDSAELGGMYAQKIVLVGTEAGVGVRNAGTLGASAGNVHITADGLLQNTGQITASAQVTLDAQAGIVNTGTVYAGSDAHLSTRGNIANQGTGLIAAGGHARLEALGQDSVITSDLDATLAAGLHTEGEGEQAKMAISGTVGDLGLQAVSGIDIHGTSASAGEQRLSAKAITLAGSCISSGQNLWFATLEGDFDARGASILAGGALHAALAGAARTDHATVNAGQLSLTAQSLSNEDGRLVQLGMGQASINLAGAFNNKGGTLASQGGVTVAASSIDNTAGFITTHDAPAGSPAKADGQGDIVLSTNTFTNQGGVVSAAKGGATVSALGAIDNTHQGTIRSDGLLTLTSHGLDNTGGSLGGKGVRLDAQMQAVENAQGQIVSTGDIDIQSGRFNNDEGYLQAQERFSADTHGQLFSNNHSGTTGGLVALVGAKITSGGFQNQGGFIRTGDEGLRVNGQAISNTEGEIHSTGLMTLSGTDLDNRGGIVDVAGGVGIHVGAGTVDNTGSLIRSGGLLAIQAGTLLNSNTRSTSPDAAALGLQGESIAIQAQRVANHSGAILANQDLDIASAGSLDNSGGLVSSVHALRILDTASPSLAANTLTVTNTGGTLLANDSLSLNASRITLDGKLHSNSDLDLKVNSNLANLGDLSANRNLSLTTTGNFSNSGSLTASQSLNIAAANIDNTSTGRMLSASTSLSASGTLTNRGLIDGDDTVLKAQTLDNLGTGRIYGTRLSLAADTLNNTDRLTTPARRSGPLFHPWNASWYLPPADEESSGASGTIAARERLDVGAKTVNNGQGAHLQSDGDLHFGGGLDAANQASGQGALVRNTSGTISADGKVTWGVDKVINERAHMAYDQTTTATTVSTLVADTGGTGAYRITQNETTTVKKTIFSEEKSSAAGKISSGGDMDFGDAAIVNNASKILVGGTLTHNPAKYTTPFTDEVVTTVTATTTTDFRDKCRRHETCHYKHHRSEVTPVLGTPEPDVQRTSRGAELLFDQAVHGAPPPSGLAIPSLNTGVTAQAVQGATAAASSSVNPAAPPAGTPTAPEMMAAPLDLRLPTGSLYQTQSAPGSRFLVNTDTQFAGYRRWLDSDYMLIQLGIDPSSLGKRLGDGYYEQRLIREQTNELLGKRLLDKQQNNETEYLVLMNNGILFAKASGLKPGTALSAEQISQLPSDMVWLVNRDITLPDGTTTQALVPQVYAKVQAGGRAAATDGVIAGNRIDYTVASGNFDNTGTLTARDTLTIRADNINNLGGRIQSGNVSLAARTDVNNVGGQILGADNLLVSAGRDVNVSSTRVSRQSGNAFVQNASTAVDKVGSFSVTQAGGALLVEAGRNVNLTAAHLSHTGAGGQTSLSANNDINLLTAETGQIDAFALDAGNHSLRSRTEDVGTLVEATGDVWLKAKNDVNARAARVTSAEGLVSLDAGRELNLLAGRQALRSEDARQTTAYRLFENKTIVTDDTVEQVAGIGTLLQGKDVQLKAGQDITVQASSVTATQRLDVNAGRDLLLTAADTRRTEAHDRHTHRSANGFGELMGKSINASGGFDIGLAIMQKKTEDKEVGQTQQTAQGSVLNAGTVQSHSGRDTRLQAATVVADNDIAIQADGSLSLLVSAQAKTDTGQSSSYTNGQVGSWYQPAMGTVKQSRSNSGSSNTLVGTQVTSLHGDVNLEAQENFTQTASQIAAPEGNIDIAAKQVSIQQGQETGESQSSVQYGKTAFGGSISIPLVSALQSIKGMADATKDTGDARMKGLAAVNTALAAKEAYSAATSLMGGSATGIKVSVNLSHDESRSADQQSGSNAVGSLIAAGGDVNIRALGAGQASQLSVVGSQIDAGSDVHLKSDGAVLLKAAENTAHQQGSHSSSGVSIGVGFAFGGSQNGFTIDLAASMSRGKADGDDSLWTHTHVNAGKTFTLESGGDTTLQGAVVKADRITGKVGGNLSIASLQDSSTFNSQQMSAGFAISLCIPPICEGMSSVSADASQSEIDSKAIRVAEQSGFRAGDGGYQITVQGNTDLTGGVIASSNKAIADGKNQFEHGGAITQRDIENRVEFKGSSWAVSAGVGGKLGDGNKGSTTSTNPTHKDDQPSASFGLGFDEGLQTSVTRSGIGVSTSEDTAGILKPIFDAGKVQRELNAQTRITKTFSQAAPRAIADFANTQTRPVEDAQEYERLQDKQQSGEKLTADESRTMADLENRGMTAEQARANLSDSKALEDYENWKEGGLYRVAAHTVVGALGGGVEGAVGAGTVAAAAPVLDSLQREVNLGLIGQGISEQGATLISQALGGMAAAGVGAAVAGGTGGGFALATDTNNRQLHRKELDRADVLAAKSRGRYTARQIADAMRASGNSDYNETIITGLVVDLKQPKDKVDAAFYDRAAGPSGWAMGNNAMYQNLKPVDPDLAAFVRANTGGVNSPYFDLAPPPAAAAEGKTDDLNRDNFQHQPVSANGKTFSVPVADCPPVSCTEGAPIAWFSQDSRDQATLKAYKEALLNRDLKAGADAALTVGIAATLPVSWWGMAIGGAAVAGGDEAAGQLIDNGKIDDSGRVAEASVKGGVLGGLAYGAGVIASRSFASMAALDDVFLAGSAGKAPPTANGSLSSAGARASQTVGEALDAASSGRLGFLDFSASGNIAPGFYRANPVQIRFTQSDASPFFSKGSSTIDSLVADLRAGKITADQVGDPLQIVMHDNLPFSIDNRRLVAFNLAGVKDVPIQIVSLENSAVAARFFDRFDPIGGLGQNIVITPSSGRPTSQMLLRNSGLIKGVQIGR